MARAILRLIFNPETRKRDLYVKYESDADALPFEHEEDHRALVDKLLEGGALKLGELGQVIVEREEVEWGFEPTQEEQQEEQREAEENSE